MQNATDFLDGGKWPEYIIQYDSESWRGTFNAEEFWPRYQLITGRDPGEHKSESFFSCSC